MTGVSYCRYALVFSYMHLSFLTCCLFLAGIQFRLPTSCSVDRAQPPPGTILSPLVLLASMLAHVSVNYISAAVTHP